ncbi:MAG: Rne/Rng family ribonuclease [Puniceicoccales bacterium]|jgi:ribonuclease G|nr:Rne/Rng family ribonuclease [Puniceicoccales bacterium]
MDGGECGEVREEGQGVAVDRQALAEGARERARQRPFLQRVLKGMSKGDRRFREVLIGRNFVDTRLALLVDGRMEALEVERADGQNWVGAIFKGRIQNLEPGLKAAFVITGQEKNAFLHYWDMLPAANDAYEIVANHGSGRRELTLEDIPKAYPVGAELMVQVIKAQIGTKGPRVTTNITLSGRYLVLTPFNGQCGISRKIEDAGERERLKEILRELAVPDGMGLVIRTAGAEKKLKYFVRDLSLLLQEWERIAEKMQRSPEPCLLYREPDLVGRAVRDFLTDEVDRVVVDSPAVFSQLVQDVGTVAPKLKGRVYLHDKPVPLFEYYSVEKQILQTFSRKVTLPSGGEIVIEETEALIAIDVNTGSHHRRREGGDGGLILAVNLEAADEIVRQMRLRNLGGLIIVDFIDMKNRADQKKILDAMQAGMEKDSARFQILPISPFGMMQITRQRHSQSLTNDTRRRCPYCDGRGTLESPQTTAIRVQSSISAQLGGERREALALRITVHPEVMHYLREFAGEFFGEMEARHNAQLTFCASEALHRENFTIQSVPAANPAPAQPAP